MPVEDTGAEQPNGQENNRPGGQNVQPSSPDFSDLVNTYANEQKSNRDQKHLEYRKNLFISLLTLFFVILTTIGVFIQAFILNYTDKTMDKQIRVSARPWVGLTDDMNPIQTSHVRFNTDGDAQVTYAIVSKNYSNSAATGVTAHAKLLISEDIPYIFGAALDEACSDNYVSLNSWGGSVLFPGKSHHVIETASLVKRSDIKAGTEGKAEAWLVGCVGYRDQFSFLYKTKFVYWYANPATSVGIEFYPAPNAEIIGQFIEHHSAVQ